VRKAGLLCQNAMAAMVARCEARREGIELRRAAGACHPGGRRRHLFLIIGFDPDGRSGPGCSAIRPSLRPRARQGDIVNWSWLAGIAGYTRRSGSPHLCLASPTEIGRRFWRTSRCPGLPAHHRRDAGPGKPRRTWRLSVTEIDAVALVGRRLHARRDSLLASRMSSIGLPRPHLGDVAPRVSRAA